MGWTGTDCRLGGKDAMRCDAARRSRPVFRLETLRWNLEIERAGNQVQVGSPGLGQGSAVPGVGGGKVLGGFQWGRDSTLCPAEPGVHGRPHC